MCAGLLSSWHLLLLSSWRLLLLSSWHLLLCGIASGSAATLPLLLKTELSTVGCHVLAMQAARSSARLRSELLRKEALLRSSLAQLEEARAGMAEMQVSVRRESVAGQVLGQQV